MSLRFTSTSPRVVVASANHPCVNPAGSELAAYALFTGLKAQGVDVHFLAACRRSDQPKLVLGDREHAFVIEEGEYDVFYHLASPELKERALAAIHALAPNVVSFQHYIGFGLNTVRDLIEDGGAKVAITLHEFLPICLNNGQMVTRPSKGLCRRPSDNACHTCFPDISPQRFHLRRNLLRSILERADLLVAPSRFLAEVYKDWGLKGPPIKVIENGLVRLPKRVAPRPAEAPPVFGFFGQVTPTKGVDVLLEAAELLQGKGFEGQIRIHGNLLPGLEPNLARLSDPASLPRCVKYFGPYPNAEVGDLMGACDFVVVPSIWWENSPIVIQEALAVGRPVICSNIGGMAEKVSPGVAGLHFQVGDAADLARTMYEVAHNRRSDPTTFKPFGDATSNRMASVYMAAFKAFEG